MRLAGGRAGGTCRSRYRYGLGRRPVAGLRFYERARAAIAEADEAERAARGAGAGLSGRLRVSAATTFARLHVVPMLPHFLAEHPDLDIEIVLDDRVIDLVSEGIDLALRMGTLPDSAAVVRKLATGGRSVLATPAYLARAGEPRSPAELAGHEAVVYSRQPDAWSFRGRRRGLGRGSRPRAGQRG